MNGLELEPTKEKKLGVIITSDLMRSEQCMQHTPM